MNFIRLVTICAQAEKVFTAAASSPDVAIPRPLPERDICSLEIALLGQNGLQINDPKIRYDLKSKPGDYSGLQLLSMMHVGIKQLDPKADTESGLDREYAFAMATRAKE